MNTVFVKNYPEPEINLSEILRYAKGADEGLIREVLSECKDSLSYKVCYMRFCVRSNGDELDLEFTKTKSCALSRNLDGCDEIVLFAASVGLGIDRLIAKYSHVSPAKAYVLQGIGAERIESLCDVFNAEIKADAEKRGRYTRPRFSPGYGDFTLDAQRDIFKVLDCPRKIGLSLTDSLLMSPSKSVTAIIGISDKCETSDTNKCSRCQKSDCDFRSRI